MGRAIALGLVKNGYDLVVSYNNSGKMANDLADEAIALGCRVELVQANLAETWGPSKLAASVRDNFGKLDLLVNSAATFIANDILRVRADEWDHVMAVNLRAPFLLGRECAGVLRADGGGSIVNIVDLSAFQPWTSHPHHAVSKAGLLHLTRVMARRLAPEVRVNAIAPGEVLLPENYTEAEIAKARARAPLGLGRPEDVAEAVLYLAHAEYVTGEVIVIDGGQLAGRPR